MREQVGDVDSYLALHDYNGKSGWIGPVSELIA
jgi:hypothetical protein